MPVSAFHPATASWFTRSFDAPTDVQREAWPAIQSGKHTLLAAPTGSGKTLAAFLAAIDALVREGLERGLPDQTRVLYISPLKALSNDIQKNLQAPLAGIREELFAQGRPDVDVRALVRTGDTPQSERAKMRRQPPHILVTTPESAYILLTSESGREMLASVRTVIVDEIHAVAGTKRGAHLSLTLERLEALTGQPLTRIGLSATQKPIERMAHFLIGARDEPVTIIDTGHVRERDMALELPGSPLETVLSAEVWEEIYNRLAELIARHRTTLIFVNTRRLAERAARHLAERIGEEHVTSHHGSLSREHRLHAEQRLKAGNLRALIATASLELGIDIGDVDLVCQLGSPRSIAAFLQRVGRSGHAIDKQPKGRLFPLSRDDLVECTALLGAARRGELDQVHIPEQPLDVLAQQIVAEVSGGEWAEEALYEMVKRAWPYRDLSREQFDQVVGMLAQGFSTRRGRRGAYLHRDAVNQRLRPRLGARIVAMTNGGAIPDQFDYEVKMLPEGLRVGTLNEDFAFESLPGDIFQLGNTSWRILKVAQGTVFVEDARGQPPNMPFWLGEAPGRTDELSQAVSELRGRTDGQLEKGMDATERWLAREYGIDESAAAQLAAYLAGARAALSVVPTQQRIVFERFFDDVGDMHLVIHSPYGSRLNRAWGLALRKRFCRKFNFELQAAALEDSIVLSLGPTHSFPLDEVAGYLKRESVCDLLVQALLEAPMFGTHWRWNATIALAVKRNHNGKRLPAQFQRSDAEDLISVVFPDQVACVENLAGRREIPAHPLVAQTIHDCLTEVMDLRGLERVLERLEAGEIEVIARDLPGPSPLAQEVLNARPYAFLDDAPAEERRTLAIQSRSYLDPADAAELARLDPEAIARVQAEAWPAPRTADELHDALMIHGFLTAAEAERGAGHARGLAFGWGHLLDELIGQRRATVLTPAGGEALWVAAERLAEVERIVENPVISPKIVAITDKNSPQDEDAALVEVVRSRLECLGPTTPDGLSAPLGLPPTAADRALLALETEGFVVRGHFMRPDGPIEWCERRLLARIHRYTLKRLRSEIEPVPPAVYLRFLLEWQGLGEERPEGDQALTAALDRLEGFSTPAAAWESDLLPVRVRLYLPQMLDAQCAAGCVVWQRLGAGSGNGEQRSGPVSNTPIALLARGDAAHWQVFAPPAVPAEIKLSVPARTVADALSRDGASFFSDLVQSTGLLRTQVESALAELVAWGLVTSDLFAGLRALTRPVGKRPGFGRAAARGRRGATGVDAAGRWVLLKRTDAAAAAVPERERRAESVEHIAWTLLRRYGVVFRRVLERESGLPPWRELLRVYWRMEARGELRGGRFVQSFSGEQFALAEAVAALRKIRREGGDGRLIAVSAADPLNLVGIITPGERVPALRKNRILYRDGVPVAVQSAGEVRFIGELDSDAQWDARQRLVRSRIVSTAVTARH
ncbi:MAG: DEAD/DEAH box helicase [Gammaproteobacteria bacterium]|nr:DEAD/DEAH box helicase [Gammaproteobacteria bacterium]